MVDEIGSFEIVDSMRHDGINRYIAIRVAHKDGQQKCCGEFQEARLTSAKSTVQNGRESKSIPPPTFSMSIEWFPKFLRAAEIKKKTEYFPPSFPGHTQANWVNNPALIRKNKNVVAINSCIEIDISGQVRVLGLFSPSERTERTPTARQQHANHQRAP